MYVLMIIMSFIASFCTTLEGTFGVTYCWKRIGKPLKVLAWFYLILGITWFVCTMILVFQGR